MNLVAERAAQFISYARENISTLHFPQRPKFLRSEEVQTLPLILAAMAITLVPMILQADNIKKMGGVDPNFTRQLITADNPPTYNPGCKILMTPGRLSRYIEVCPNPPEVAEK